MKKIRLFGNISDLVLTNRNSTCDFYRLTLWVKIGGSWECLTAKGGFNGYSKKEIFKKLKGQIITDLEKHWGVIAG